MELLELLRLFAEDANRATAESNAEAIATITQKMIEYQEAIIGYAKLIRILVPIIAIAGLLYLGVDAWYKWTIEKRIKRLELSIDKDVR